MEPRGVEPLSEDQRTRASPSAVCVLTFPPHGSHRRDPGISSFIKSHRRQSLWRLVPCYYDADGLRGRTLRVDGRRLSGDGYEVSFVSYLFFPVVRRFRAAARFTAPSHPRRNQIRPHVGKGRCLPFDQFLARIERSMSRWASRRAMSSRLSYSFLPLHSASSSFMRPSFRYTLRGISARPCCITL